MNRRATTGITVVGVVVGAVVAFAGSSPTAAAAPSARRQQCLDLNADFTDGEIAHVLFVLNAGELREARAVADRLVTDETRAFAKRMMREHTDAVQMLRVLVDARKIDMAPNALSAQLDAASRNAVADLDDVMPSGLNDVGFVNLDTAYLQDQMTSHEEALAVIDNQLLPSARDPALVSFLFDARSMVLEHLQEVNELLHGAGRPRR
jgi:predicted outer membrane protein